MFLTDAALQASAGRALMVARNFRPGAAKADLRLTNVTAADPLRRQHGSGK
jgi:hypothetical protein